ncbi:MAG: ShlB/FhaC/HecB family hemolysin secretion/activation protein [Gallionella sp.]|nr:ShlB/FhaC/HecB family hemolysin secretion/activation protein [Gallionella sp.]
MKTQQQFPRSALAIILFASLSAHAAPVAPDAGQTIRELQKQPELNAPKVITPLRPDGESAPKDAANKDVRIAVKAIHVSGNSVFIASELEALVANLIGGEHTLAELDAGAARITAYYRERGYVVARAYLPEQEIKDGVVTIKVLEGIVGQQRIHNQALLTDDRANGYLGGKSGDVLQSKPVDRTLLLLADTPGVGGARAILQPGASVGTSDLLIELIPSAPYSANIELDNYGNRYTGEYRLGAALALNSPLKIGDQLSLRALASDRNLTYARIAYSIPLGGDGLRVGAAYSDLRYRLGKEFTGLQAHGSAINSSLFAVYPFIRSLTSNLSGTLTWEDKQLNDRFDALGTTSDKHVQLANFGLAGSHQDALGGAGVTAFDLSYVTGKLGMDATSLAADAASAQSNGSFTRFAYSVNRLQRLSDTNMLLSVALSGQQAGKNLNSSEKFILGGATGVRAYPQGEGNGDEGWLANLELRHNFAQSVQGVLFYDAGSVDINRNQFAAGANTRNISGAGIGANAHFAGVQIKAYLAWRTGGGQPTSEPATLNRNPRLWLQANKVF